MKSISLCLALAIGALSISSCESIRKFVGKTIDNSEFVAPVVSLLTTIVFDRAVSESDQAAKAQVVINLADKLAALQFTTVPTPEEVTLFVASNLPDKQHWSSLAGISGVYYGKATEKLDDSDVTAAMALLKEVAVGLKTSASAHL